MEAAWLSLALAETRAAVWDRLDEPVRRRVVHWLAAVHGKDVFDNNWLLYPVLVDGFLATVSGPTDPAGTGRALGRVETMYRGDGWYSDGPGTCCGHYSAWGMQLLLGHWLRLTGGDAYPGGAAVVRERMRAFLPEYSELIGPDGAPVLHGRSLVYRFAAAAPFWLGTLLEASPFSGASTRRRTSAIVRHFVWRGALDGGLPPLGWYGPFAPMADAYSTPLSPLLCSQAFVGLLVPAYDPAWTDVEPDDLRPTPTAGVLSTPGFGCMTGGDGVLRVVSHGATSDQVADHPGFCRVAYSTHSSPAAGALGELELDGQVTVQTAGGAALRRRAFTVVSAADCFAASRWEPSFVPVPGSRRLVSRLVRRARALMGLSSRPRSSGIRVECASVVRPDMELRVTAATGLGGGTIRDGGLAVSHDDAPRVSHGDGWCAATTADGMTGAVVGLHGWSSCGWRTGVEATPFGHHTVVPFVDGPGTPQAPLVTAHLLTFEPVDADGLRASVKVSAMGDGGVFLAMADGEEYFVQLGPAAARCTALGDVELDGTYRFARSSPDGASWALPEP